ncbi:MAG: hypothetical protein JW910_21115 [Anaerolineae bacterium]|nr:hypothetical protein [Anaerolineae bacterium]
MLLHQRALVRLTLGGLLLLGVAACVPAPTPTPLPVTPTPRYEATPSPGDQVLDLPNAMDGQAVQVAGPLLSDGAGASAAIFMQVAGLWPASPTASSRRVALRLTCTGSGTEYVRWRPEPTKYEEDEGLPPMDDLACGDLVSVFFSYDVNYRRVTVDVPPGPSTDLIYTLAATVHLPY